MTTDKKRREPRFRMFSPRYRDERDTGACKSRTPTVARFAAAA